MPAVRRSKAMEFFWRVHPWIYEKTKGRIGARILGLPVLLLTTTGRRSGRSRTTPAMYVRRDNSYVVAASYAGEPRHPAWWLNLKAKPEARIRVGREVFSVRAREAEGAERAELWAAIVAQDSGFAEYEKRTTRRIPVVVLELEMARGKAASS